MRSITQELRLDMQEAVTHDEGASRSVVASCGVVCVRDSVTELQLIFSSPAEAAAM